MKSKKTPRRFFEKKERERERERERGRGRGRERQRLLLLVRVCCVSCCLCVCVFVFVFGLRVEKITQARTHASRSLCIDLFISACGAQARPTRGRCVCVVRPAARRLSVGVAVRVCTLKRRGMIERVDVECRTLSLM